MDLATAHEFISAVLYRSETVPVLVDFWAPWCAPCKMLKPVLEKLAAEAGGQWELVKVDTEKLPVLAQQFGIRGIPDVKLFYQGNVVAQFSGALPEPQVRAWLEQNLPARSREALTRAYAALAAGHWNVAEDQLATLRPSDRTAEHTAVLALARVFRDPAGALASLTDHHDEAAERVRTLANLFALDTRTLPEFSARLPLLGGLAELRAGRLPEALRLLLASMEESVRYADGAAQRACRIIFEILGPSHPLVEEFDRAYRRVARTG